MNERENRFKVVAENPFHLHLLLPNDEQSVAMKLFFSDKIVDDLCRAFERPRFLDGQSYGKKNSFKLKKLYAKNLR